MMSPDSSPSDAEPPDDSVDLLRDLEIEPASDLPGRVRRGIERRFLSRDLVGFYWSAVGSVAVEWLSVFLDVWTTDHPPKREQR